MEQAIEETSWLGNEDHVLANVYTPELVRTLEQHLNNAEKLARGNAVAEPHVLGDRVTFDHLRAYQAMVRAENDADFAEAARRRSGCWTCGSRRPP